MGASMDTMTRDYWLFKSEPETFSIDHLMRCSKQTEHWDGVRNYQARNLLRDKVKQGDYAFFYHSNCLSPGIVGMVEVVKSGYPDFTAWDIRSEHFDRQSSDKCPRWFMVDVRFLEKFSRVITLQEIKHHPLLKTMWVAKKGNRLSITPVEKEQWKIICHLANGYEDFLQTI
jgi:predicted RNA-binding protein with PUA-like domain